MPVCGHWALIVRVHSKRPPLTETDRIVSVTMLAFGRGDVRGRAGLLYRLTDCLGAEMGVQMFCPKETISDNRYDPHGAGRRFS